MLTFMLLCFIARKLKLINFHNSFLTRMVTNASDNCTKSAAPGPGSIKGNKPAAGMI